MRRREEVWYKKSNLDRYINKSLNVTEYIQEPWVKIGMCLKLENVTGDSITKSLTN